MRGVKVTAEKAYHPAGCMYKVETRSETDQKYQGVERGKTKERERHRRKLETHFGKPFGDFDSGVDVEAWKVAARWARCSDGRAGVKRGDAAAANRHLSAATG